MSTGARASKIPDVLRMGRAMRQPGIDPRVWATGGRVVEEGDSIRWDSDLGFVVDVGAYGGGLQGDVVVARVATNHPNEFIPLDKDCEVIVVVPEGETDGIPSIVGQLNNADGCEAPGEIHSLLIDGSIETTVTPFDALFGPVSPFDTEIKVSPHSRREEYGGDHIDSAANQVLEASKQVRLAMRDADQSFIRGEKFTEALGLFLDATDAYVAASGPANLAIYAAVNLLAPGTVTPPQIAQVTAAVAQTAISKLAYDFSLALPGELLSIKIKGD